MAGLIGLNGVLAFIPLQAFTGKDKSTVLRQIDPYALGQTLEASCLKGKQQIVVTLPV